MPRLLAGVVAVFLPFTPQKEAAEHAASTSIEAATSHLAISALRRATEGAASAAAATVSEGVESASTETGGVDITTTKLLAILACMSFFAFIWEQVTSLDGPNAEHECAADEYLSRADDTHTPKSALSTPKWRGES